MGATATLAIPGCSIYYSYELDTTVRAPLDGQAVKAVKVKLEAEQLCEWPTEPLTDNDGKFSFTFKVSARVFRPEGALPKWRLVLSKEGFHDETVDISPRRAPKSGGQITQMTVIAYIRPK